VLDATLPFAFRPIAGRRTENRRAPVAFLRKRARIPGVSSRLQIRPINLKAFIFIALASVLGSIVQPPCVFAAASGAQETVQVDVPKALQSAPFNRNRTLNVPAGAKISVLARVPEARFLAVGPEGEILVSQPGRGKILLIRSSDSAEPQISELTAGLRLPHGMVFERVGEKTYLYVSE
jgi:hypothetical protein